MSIRERKLVKRSVVLSLGRRQRGNLHPTVKNNRLFASGNDGGGVIKTTEAVRKKSRGRQSKKHTFVASGRK